MANTTDLKITTRIPFLKGKMVLLVEDTVNPIPVSDKYYWEEAKYRFKEVGYNFLSLPELLASIHPVIASYLFPGFDIPDASEICRKIRSIAGIGNKSGLLYKKGGNTYFKGLSSPHVFVEDAVRELLDSFHEHSFLRFAWNLDTEIEVEVNESVDKDILLCPDSFEIEPTPRFGIEKKKEKKRIIHKASKPKFSIVSEAIEEELDPNTVSILAEVKKILETYNLTLDELEVILGYTVKLSHMQITFNGDIFLTDFKDEFTGKPIEITKMDDLTKMVYLFYLKHPEGVRIKELENHIDELMHLYMKISGRDDKDAIRARILNHVAPYSNNVNVCMSRIKSAFKSKVGEKVAAFYWIKGKSGEPYNIELDRDYVLWEY